MPCTFGNKTDGHHDRAERIALDSTLIQFSRLRRTHQSSARMRAVIPQNHRAKVPLATAEGHDLAPFQQLPAMLRDSFSVAIANEPYRSASSPGYRPDRTSLKNGPHASKPD